MLAVDELAHRVEVAGVGGGSGDDVQNGTVQAKTASAGMPGGRCPGGIPFFEVHVLAAPSCGWCCLPRFAAPSP